MVFKIIWSVHYCAIASSCGTSSMKLLNMRLNYMNLLYRFMICSTKRWRNSCADCDKSRHQRRDLTYNFAQSYLSILFFLLFTFLEHKQQSLVPETCLVRSKNERNNIFTIFHEVHLILEGFTVPFRLCGSTIWQIHYHSENI